MDQASKNNQIFKNGSTTYYYSTKFFPEDAKKDVTSLYAFVRVVDDYVDNIPANREKFFEIKDEYYKSLNVGSSGDPLVNDFIETKNRLKIKDEWIDAFFESMESDLDKSTYENIDQVEKYIYGSANVIGLCMCRILNLKEESYDYAEQLGKSMQFINFVRDIAEDIELGRVYMPQDEIKKFGLESLEVNHVKKNQDSFNSFIRHQINRYRKWQKEAEQGFNYLPRIFKIPVKTASEMFDWTADQIEKNPMIIYEKKVKPSKFRVAFAGFKNLIFTK